ncbi:MAG: type 3 dihydrofolate reductase [Gammaproteobacteria bacterium]
MSISLIVATSKNGVIGLKNHLPWHLPADLAYFKKVTLNKPIIMGRKTFESIGKPLPMRENIVITHQKDFNVEGVTIFHSLYSALNALKEHHEIMIIGGETLFKQSIELADKIYLTMIHENIEGDTYFPQINYKIWNEVSRENHSADEKNTYNYSFIILER